MLLIYPTSSLCPNDRRHNASKHHAFRTPCNAVLERNATIDKEAGPRIELSFVLLHVIRGQPCGSWLVAWILSDSRQRGAKRGGGKCL